MEKTPSAQIGLSPSESTMPEHSVVIAPARGWASLQVRAIWEYRELLYFLVWRDLKVRYKQTVLGVVWILLQPVLAVSDAIILGTRVDGVVLVSDVGRTRRREARRAVEEIRRIRVNLLGVVLNRLSRRCGGYYNHHHHYYYQSENDQHENRHRWRSWLRHRQSREKSDE